jgi:hypothetical protein
VALPSLSSLVGTSLGWTSGGPNRDLDGADEAIGVV